VERLPEPQCKARLKITWQRDQNWHEWATVTEGCYILRSNLCDVDPKTLWKRYIQLTEVEWAFRIAKDELAIRPIWHQKEDRVLAHILVCFLAYVRWKTLAGWMQRSRLGDAPRTLLEEFAKIKSGDVVLRARWLGLFDPDRAGHRHFAAEDCREKVEGNGEQEQVVEAQHQ
jgi:transposase